MNKLRLSLVFAFVAFSGLTAQEVENTEVQGPKINTINQQFEDLYNDSNSWEDYKNIKKGDFIKLQKNAVDSISNLKTEIASLQANIDSQKSEVNQLNDSLVETKSTLASTIEEKDSIFFFGIPMSKVGYMTMMWAIVGVLALGLVLFIYKYKGSNAHTQEARKKLNETELEYDEYRKKALEKEQKMGRMLQDERNKALKNTKNN
ncbi:hypothetical protein [Leeuwenhoekiella sp. W20_SRS_FM14]|uniref:hypothetical protein n=1 Tax=Leeuwenhoekiella sp. W20_SRS_FM14 TaxID=3240270 RepID=UPI003F9A0A06